MPPTDTLSYDLVERLVQTLEILRQGPATARQISEMLAPDSVPATESEVRRTLRDMRALERLGFQIEERGKPIRFTLRGGTTPSFDDEEVQTLALIRETFSEGYPHSDAVQRLLERMTAALSDHQRRIYTRRPTLRLPLRTAVDYRPYDHLIRWLEDRITKRQQIAFDYRPLSTSSIVRYDRLDPYEIEYFHNHFYDSLPLECSWRMT
jgi:predicted DNA-binding transcriptional regulator YafY